MSGTVYFVQSERGGPIKIGHTTGDPKTRMRSIQTGSPERLRVIASFPGSRADEMRLHDALSTYRLTGEWFRDCPAVREVIGRMSDVQEYEFEMYGVITATSHEAATHVFNILCELAGRHGACDPEGTVYLAAAESE